MDPRPFDEMVDGRGGLRPHWRHVLGAFAGMGEQGLAERISRLDEAFAEEGITGLLPGGGDGQAWRCDPVPLPLTGVEFSWLEAGLKQRARLLEALLQDLYGPQSILREGLLPPALVYTNPGFLRACHQIGPLPGGRVPMLQQYAADLIRCPDGQWRVLADRTAIVSGMAYARENRRMLGRMVPEAFKPLVIRKLRPFFEVWQDALQRLVPPGRDNPAIAVLTPGPTHPGWFEHLYLARELSAALVEAGDLSIRDGRAFLKTLRGLLPIDVLVRRIEGSRIDPLEMEGPGDAGIAGLMQALREGQLRVVNDPGTGLVEAPALAAFLPQIAVRLLDQTLALPSLPTLWLGSDGALATVASDPGRWLIRPASDGRASARLPDQISGPARAAMWRAVTERPRDHAATDWMMPSQAPCGTAAGLEPRPIVLRMFLVFDGADWHMMPGGLAHVLDASARIGGRLPYGGISKDVWVIAEEGEDIVGPAALSLPRLAIRRVAAELPSRIADNLFWFGRYMERLEDHARLVRATMRRLGRGSHTPRDLAELRALARCLHQAGVLEQPADPAGMGPGPLAAALLGAVREGGRIHFQLGRVAQLIEAVRDRLTDDIYATFTHMERAARAETVAVGDDLERLGHAMNGVLRFAAAVAGVAAENMVRGGGWLFLDLGRRIERAQEISSELQLVFEQPVSRIESGLRLALELCDSAITYRNRYLTVLQSGPVLDLVLADPSNPRALGFQLAAIETRLRELIGEDADPMVIQAQTLRLEVVERAALVAASAAPDREATALPPELGRWAGVLADLAEQLSRRYFTLLPTPQSLDGSVPQVSGTMRGAA